jgi:hypothetical protein
MGSRGGQLLYLLLRLDGGRENAESISISKVGIGLTPKIPSRGEVCDFRM